MENRHYVVARLTADGIDAVSIATRSLAEAQAKRERAVENTGNTGYFIAYADIPEPQWQEAGPALMARQKILSKKVGEKC